MQVIEIRVAAQPNQLDPIEAKEALGASSRLPRLLKANYWNKPDLSTS